jgi:signal transduction histidine kinase
MIAYLKPRLNVSQIASSNIDSHTPILRLSRIYYILITCAVLIVSISLYSYYRRTSNYRSSQKEMLEWSARIADASQLGEMAASFYDRWFGVLISTDAKLKANQMQPQADLFYKRLEAFKNKLSAGYSQQYASRFIFLTDSIAVSMKELENSIELADSSRRLGKSALSTEQLALVVERYKTVNAELLELWREISRIQDGVFRSEQSTTGLLHRFDLTQILLMFVLMGGAAVYGFKIISQANVDAANSARFFQETKQRTKEIATLYDTSQALSEQLDLSALLQIIVEQAKKLLATSGVAIFLCDTEKGDLEIAAEVGVGMPVGNHIPLHEGLAGHVAKTLEPLIVNDYRNWPYRSEKLKQLPISAAICVPIVRAGELIGVLGVHEVEETVRQFTEADAQLLSLFASNAAGAVYNARLLKALRNSEERFRIAAGCASDIVYDWDLARDHVNYFGAVFERVRASGSHLSKTRQEFWDIVHPDDLVRVKAALKDHYENGIPFSEEYRVLNENGNYINVLDRATAIRDEKGNPVKLIGAVSDITERKQAEQMKSDFVSFVTHQLRTPLSGVKWMLELAMDESESSADRRSFIEDARASTERLIHLVNDLLDVARLERGRFQITCKNVDLADLTKCVVDEISPLILEKGQALSIQAEEDLPPLCADPQLLRQVILNLTSNAMKYTKSGGEISIHMSHDDHRVYWQIKDTGIGIPKTDLSKMFEKFYRANNALTVETEGTGLGLYLVRLIVERFGGNVWCESEEGSGSTFKFYIPLAA